RSSIPASSTVGGTNPNANGCAWITSACCSRARSEPREPLRRPADERRLGVVLRHDTPSIVPECEPVARGLRGRLLAEPLSQVPVHPFMQVQEPEDLSLGPEGDAFGQPDELQALARPAPCPVRNDLAERKERLGDLQGDRPPREVRPGGQVRPLPLAERPNLDRAP